MGRTAPTTAVMMMGWILIAGVAAMEQVPFPGESDTAAEIPMPLMAGMSGQAAPRYAGLDGLPDTAPVQLASASVFHLKKDLNSLGYVWRDADTAIPRVRLAKFPSDMDRINRASVRKRLFFQTMLPILAMENERVARDRKQLLTILKRRRQGHAPSAFEVAWLTDLAERYRVKGWPLTRRARLELVRRVDVVPMSLALAMSAFESGWGTSRFTDEGNNLFGEWTFRPGTGMVPRHRTKGRTHEVAVFPDITASVHSFIRNLNTHWAYADFRERRKQLRGSKRADMPMELARTLLRYSERGQAYVDDITRIIRLNRLTRFDGVSLDNGDSLRKYRKNLRETRVS